MLLHFTKFHGTGNDFILVDNRKNSIELSSGQIQHLCNRHLGIGADGLMLMKSESGYDFSMLYYNADGLEGSMCGNGGRCIAAFAYISGIKKPTLVFKAVDGVHEAVVKKQGANVFDVSVSLNDVNGIERLSDQTFVLDTGSPHYVKFISDPNGLDVLSEGKKIRWDSRFQPDGINVNFVWKENQMLYVKTYERGVENLTLSCGTGVTASAIAASANVKNGPVALDIHTLGGLLHTSFQKEDTRFTNVQLRGNAVNVFTGNIKIS